MIFSWQVYVAYLPTLKAIVYVPSENCQILGKSNNTVQNSLKKNRIPLPVTSIYSLSYCRQLCPDNQRCRFFPGSG